MSDLSDQYSCRNLFCDHLDRIVRGLEPREVRKDPAVFRDRLKRHPMQHRNQSRLMEKCTEFMLRPKASYEAGVRRAMT